LAAGSEAHIQEIQVASAARVPSGITVEPVDGFGSEVEKTSVIEIGGVVIVVDQFVGGVVQSVAYRSIAVPLGQPIVQRPPGGSRSGMSSAVERCAVCSVDDPGHVGLSRPSHDKSAGRMNRY
jgi:hypothetical protein